jgi:hypothetical protein
MYHFLNTQFSPPPNPTRRLEPNRRRAPVHTRIRVLFAGLFSVLLGLSVHQQNDLGCGLSMYQV